MVTLKGKTIYLYNKEISFRYGIDGLTSIIYANFTDEEIDKGIFVFFNKNRHQIKMIEYDNKGTWLYQKKLYDYKFVIPESDKDYKGISKRELKAIFDGVKLISRRNR